MAHEISGYEDLPVGQVASPEDAAPTGCGFCKGEDPDCTYCNNLPDDERPTPERGEPSPDSQPADCVLVPQLVRDMMATQDTELGKMRILQAWASIPEPPTAPQSQSVLPPKVTHEQLCMLSRGFNWSANMHLRQDDELAINEWLKFQIGVTL